MFNEKTIRQTYSESTAVPSNECVFVKNDLIKIGRVVNARLIVTVPQSLLASSGAKTIGVLPSGFAPASALNFFGFYSSLGNIDLHVMIFPNGTIMIYNQEARTTDMRTEIYFSYIVDK